MTRIVFALILMVLSPIVPATSARAESPAPALAVDPVVGSFGNTANFTGVGFTPGGRVQVLFVAGLGLVVADVTASATGTIGGKFTAPAAGLPEVTAGRQEVYAVDSGSGRETLPANYTLLAGSRLDYDLPDGHFYTQTNGQVGRSNAGYAVVNDQPFTQEVRFSDELTRLGSVPLVGFPVSRSFVLDGFSTQAFQKAIFQWRPDVGQAFFLNVFDLLHDRGFDPVLLAYRSVPPQLPTSFDAGKSSDQVAKDRLALLDANQAIRAAYYAVQNPLLHFGLPTSRVEDMGSHFAIRLQRAVIQQWATDVSWARAGQATIANGGDVFKELNQLPRFSVVPQAAPTFAAGVVVYQPARGATVSGSLRLVGDGQAFEAVVNYDLLGEGGEVLAGGRAPAASAGPVFGRFDESIPFRVDHEQPGILRVFIRSMKDGSVMRHTVAAIPLTLQP